MFETLRSLMEQKIPTRSENHYNGHYSPRKGNWPSLLMLKLEVTPLVPAFSLYSHTVSADCSREGEGM